MSIVSSVVGAALKPLVQKIGSDTYERYFGPSLIASGFERRDLSEICPRTNSGYALRVKIENVGQKPANNCEAELILQGKGEGMEMDTFRQPLLWGNRCGQRTVDLNPKGGSEWTNILIIDFKDCYFPAENGLDDYSTPPLLLSTQKAPWPTFEGEELKPLPHWSQGFQFQFLTEMEWEKNEIRITTNSSNRFVEVIEFDLDDENMELVNVGER